MAFAYIHSATELGSCGPSSRMRCSPQPYRASKSLRNLFKVTLLVGRGQSWDLAQNHPLPCSPVHHLPEVRAVSPMLQRLVSECLSFIMLLHLMRTHSCRIQPSR